MGKKFRFILSIVCDSIRYYIHAFWCASYLAISRIKSNIRTSSYINKRILMPFTNLQYMRFLPNQKKLMKTLAMRNNRAFSKGLTLYLVFPVVVIISDLGNVFETIKKEIHRNILSYFASVQMQNRIIYFG
jgi:hypothetical protein